MLEKEIRGEIDVETFEQKKKEFSEEFGEPKIYKRLALLIYDRDQREIDTRIRITNGEAEIMQKIKVEGESDDMSSKEETSIPLNKDPEIIFNAYQVLSSLFYNSNPESMLRISAETENFIWVVDDCEIKLSHLSGKFDYYNFEIEALDNKSHIKEIQKKLGLKDMFGFSTEESKKRRRDLAIKLDEISKEEFIKLIKKYLLE